MAHAMSACCRRRSAAGSTSWTLAARGKGPRSEVIRATHQEVSLYLLRAAEAKGRHVGGGRERCRQRRRVGGGRHGEGGEGEEWGGDKEDGGAALPLKQEGGGGRPLPLTSEPRSISSSSTIFCERAQSVCVAFSVQRRRRRHAQSQQGSAAPATRGRGERRLQLQASAAVRPFVLFSHCRSGPFGWAGQCAPQASE